MSLVVKIAMKAQMPGKSFSTTATARVHKSVSAAPTDESSTVGLTRTSLGEKLTGHPDDGNNLNLGSSSAKEPRQTETKLARRCYLYRSTRPRDIVDFVQSCKSEHVEQCTLEHG